MKKIRLTIFVITLLLIITIITGIVIQIISPKPLMDSTFEIIAFLVSGTSVLLAIVSQLAALKERREASKIIHELDQIIKNENVEHSITEATNKKLDQIIALDRRIIANAEKKKRPRK